MRIAVIVGALLIAGFSGAASAKTLSFTPHPDNHKVRYEQGFTAVESSLEKSYALLILSHPDSDARSPPIFEVSIINFTDQPVDFLPAAVKLVTDKDIVLSAMTRTMMQTQLDKQIRKQRFWAGVSAMGAALSSAGAAMPQTSTSSFSARTTAPGYMPLNTTGTITTTGIDPAAQMRANQQVQAAAAQRAEVDRAQQQGQVEIESLAFRSQTLRPRAVVATPVVFNVLPKDVKQAWLTIDFAGETHVFPIDVAVH